MKGRLRDVPQKKQYKVTFTKRNGEVDDIFIVHAQNVKRAKFQARVMKQDLYGRQNRKLTTKVEIS